MVRTYGEMQTIHSCVGLMLLLLLPACHRKGSDRTDAVDFRLDNLTRAEERHKKEAEMREFLWVHWHQKKSGTLNLTAISKEGKASHLRYRITLIPPSTMMLKLTVVRDRYGYQGQVIPRDDPGAGFEAYTVERIVSENPAADWKSLAPVLQEDAAADPSKYWLRFKDWEGFPISYF